jgi:hypothetical protein
MSIREFYENVILRDILQYTIPGGIVGASAATLWCVYATHMLGLPPDWPTITANWIPLSLFSFAIAYAIGHGLTAYSKGDDHRDAETSTLTTLDGSADGTIPNLVDTVVVQPIISAVQQMIGNQDKAVREALYDVQGFRRLRELLRNLAQRLEPDQFHEYVARHSILSRFCLNMAFAVSVSAGCLVTALLIRMSWDSARSVSATAVIAAVLIAASVAGNRLFKARYRNLRHTLARHTLVIVQTHSILERHAPTSKPNTNAEA